VIGVNNSSDEEEDTPTIASEKTCCTFDAGSGCSSSEDENVMVVPHLAMTGSDGSTILQHTDSGSSSCRGKTPAAVKVVKTAPLPLARADKKPCINSDKGGEPKAACKGKKNHKDDDWTQIIQGILGGGDTQDAVTKKALLEEQKFAEMQCHSKVVEAKEWIELFQRCQATKHAPWANSASIKSMFPADMAKIFIEECVRELEKDLDKSAESVFWGWEDDANANPCVAPSQCFDLCAS